ncbi:helix-turn-helix transcriptional regulator [Corynebacterium belfantii]|uniref:helix-turn-helix domain-containing protein n=2 Tax=Corynebacterium belfantii TaxID=2014537 RepID=UPI0018EFF78E
MIASTSQASVGYGADEAIGITVNDLMFRRKVTRKALASALGISPQGMSQKILGKVGWSITDLYVVAEFFNIDVTDLLPRRVPQTQETPDSLSRTEGSNLVAGAGFEPTTSGL